MLYHSGARKLEETIRSNYTCQILSTLCKKLIASCETCSEMKLTNIVKDGKMPLKDDKMIKPWELLSVDICGP